MRRRRGGGAVADEGQAKAMGNSSKQQGPQLPIVVAIVLVSSAEWGAGAGPGVLGGGC